MKSINLLMIGVLSLALSCKKENRETTARGIVRDFVTKNPLEGVEVYLQARPKDQTSNFTYQTVEKQITGGDGAYCFKFKPEKDLVYALEWQKPSECYFDGSFPRGIDKGVENEVNIDLHSWVILKLHLQNIAPFDSNDAVCFYFDKNTPDSCYNPTVGTSINYLLDAGYGNAYDYWFIKWVVTKNGITTTGLDSILVLPCDTVIYDLFY